MFFIPLVYRYCRFDSEQTKNLHLKFPQKGQILHLHGKNRDIMFQRLIIQPNGIPVRIDKFDLNIPLNIRQDAEQK